MNTAREVCSRSRWKVRGAAALFTRMSTGAPNASWAAATIVARSNDGSDRSAATAVAFPPAARIASTVSSSEPGSGWSPGCDVRPVTQTAAPSAASRSAMALPIPRLPPVTIATRPSHSPVPDMSISWQTLHPGPGRACRIGTRTRGTCDDRFTAPDRACGPDGGGVARPPGDRRRHAPHRAARSVDVAGAAGTEDRVPRVVDVDGEPSWVFDGVVLSRASASSVRSARRRTVSRQRLHRLGVRGRPPRGLRRPDAPRGDGRARHLGADRLPERRRLRRPEARAGRGPRPPAPVRDALQRRHGRDPGGVGRPPVPDGAAAVVGRRRGRRAKPSVWPASACAA